MSTAPWAADTPDLLTQTLPHVAYAWVQMVDGELLELDLIDGTVSWDERRSPRVDATLVCRCPTDAAALERIDPRLGVRLIINAGYSRPDGTQDVQTLVDLGLRQRDINKPEDTMRLFAQSDEALIIDNAPSAGGTINQASTTASIVYVLQLVIAGLSPTITTSAGAAVNQSPIGDKWDAVNDLADRIDAKVYDNGLRAWFIAPTPTSLASPVHTVSDGVNGTIVRTAKGLGREDFYNRVYLRYDWTDSGGTNHRVETVQSISTGPYAATGTNIRTLFQTRELPANTTQAAAAALAMVGRTVTRGRSLTLTAVSAYWLRPGDGLTVADVDGTVTHLASTVSFDLKTGLMDVTTRLDDQAGQP